MKEDNLNFEVIPLSFLQDATAFYKWQTNHLALYTPQFRAYMYMTALCTLFYTNLNSWVGFLILNEFQGYFRFWRTVGCKHMDRKSRIIIFQPSPFVLKNMWSSYYESLDYVPMEPFHCIINTKTRQTVLPIKGGLTNASCIFLLYWVIFVLKILSSLQVLLDFHWKSLDLQMYL